MANKKLWLGILAMVLVFGMTVIGCDDDSNSGVDPALNGTWVNSAGTIESRYNNGNYENWINNLPQAKGNYTTNGGRITSQATHIHGNHYSSYGLTQQWYTVAQAIAAGVPEIIFTSATYVYSVSGNTLTFPEIGQTYTRK